MADTYKVLENTCETLTDVLEKAEKKIRSSQQGNMSSSDATYFKDLTKSIMNIKTTLAMEDGGYGYDNSYGYAENGSSYGGSYRGSSYNDGRSGARGRNARRDRMGRNSQTGRSMSGGDDEMREHLEAAMSMARDDATRKRIERMLDEVED